MNGRRTNRDPDREVLALIGMCLICVQKAEHVLSFAVEKVLDRGDPKLFAQPENNQKQTLGDLLKRLKRQVRIEYDLKERLFEFLKMRNTFVHNLSEIPGWDLETKDGRMAAKLFLGELCFLALAISALFITLFVVSAKDEFGVDLHKDHPEDIRSRVALLEKHLGNKARKLLAGRRNKHMFVRSSRAGAS